MNIMKLKIKPNRKETQESRKERVKNDSVNRCVVFENKKKYKRYKKHKGVNYESLES
jgi:hypothetical protein